MDLDPAVARLDQAREQASRVAPGGSSAASSPVVDVPPISLITGSIARPPAGSARHLASSRLWRLLEREVGDLLIR